MAHQQNKSLLAALSNCGAECNHCATACLDEQDVKKLARCIRLNHDSAAICLFAMEAMEGGSEFVKQIYQLCFLAFVYVPKE